MKRQSRKSARKRLLPLDVLFEFVGDLLGQLIYVLRAVAFSLIVDTPYDIFGLTVHQEQRTLTTGERLHGGTGILVILLVLILRVFRIGGVKVLKRVFEVHTNP